MMRKKKCKKLSVIGLTILGIDIRRKEICDTSMLNSGMCIIFPIYIL